MKLVPYHGVLLKEYVGEILKSFDKFQVVPSSMEIFPTNLNGPLSPMVSRPSEGRAGRDTVRTSYPTPQPPGIQSGLDLADMHYSYRGIADVCFELHFRVTPFAQATSLTCNFNSA